MLALLMAAMPALAEPAGVTGVSYQDQQRAIRIGITRSVTVRTQRVANPDRLVIDLTEARLPQGAAPVVQVRSSRIRTIRFSQLSSSPAVVRVVVDLMPGFEPMVKIDQPSGRLMITLADQPPPQGERDLESLPGAAPTNSDPDPTLRPPAAEVPGTRPAAREVLRLPARPAEPSPVARTASQPPAQPVAQAPLPPLPRPAAVAPSPAPAWTPAPIPAWVPRTATSPAPGAAPYPGEPRPPVVAPAGAPRPPGTPAAGAPRPSPTASPTPRPAFGAPSTPAWGTPTATPTPEAPDPEAPAESVVPAERRASAGHGSAFEVRWQQIETLEEYQGPAPSFAYPAGINGFALEHWFWPYLGAGLDSRVMFYDLTVESVRQHRSDVALGSFVALRYPLGFLEPSLQAGYSGRTVAIESESTGTTFPFSPTQTYYGPTVAGRLKIAILPGFGLDLHGKFLPSTRGSLYPGFSSVFPLSGQGWGASLVTDILGGYVSFGYTTERLSNADESFNQTLSGITLGAGLRY